MIHQKQTMSGDLTVIGRDMFEIELKHGHPDIVLVEFKDEPNPVPCDPHQDELEWELRQRHGGFFLLIKWHIRAMRKIIWEVSFK
jgi:hypothetical protein